MKNIRSILQEIYHLSRSQPRGNGHTSQIFWALFFLVATNIVGLALPYTFGHLLNTVLGKTNYPSAEVTILFLICTILLIGVLRFRWIWLWDRFSYKFATLLNEKAFTKLSQLSEPFYSKNSKGACLSYFNNDIPNVAFQFLLNGCLIAADGLMQIIFVPMALFWLAPNLAWKVLIFTPLLPIAMFFIFKKIQELSHKEQEAFSALSESTDEVISQVATLKNLGLEAPFFKKLKKSNNTYTGYILKSAPFKALLTLSLEATPYLGSALLLLLLLRPGEPALKSPGEALAFYQYLALMTWPLMAVAMVLPHMQNGISSWRRLEKLWHKPLEPVEGKRSLADFKYFKVKNLTYTLGTQTFGPINFTLLKGQSLAICGPIGSGKSLLAKQILHLMPLPKNTIFYDDQPLEDLSFQALYSLVCYAGEESFVFGKSLRYNTALDSHIEDETIWQALQITHLDKELKEKGMSLESLICNTGSTLSGGQRQRLVLTRALLKKPKLLILDNALSSVDYETYEKIIHNLLRYQKENEMTLICISHQTDLNQKMDLCLKLEKHLQNSEPMTV